MGEAKRRGTSEERVSVAIAKREAKEKLWEEAHAERRRKRLEDQKNSPLQGKLALAVALSTLSAGMAANLKK